MIRGIRKPRREGGGGIFHSRINLLFEGVRIITFCDQNTGADVTQCRICHSERSEAERRIPQNTLLAEPT